MSGKIEWKWCADYNTGYVKIGIMNNGTMTIDTKIELFVSNIHCIEYTYHLVKDLEGAYEEYVRNVRSNKSIGKVPIDDKSGFMYSVCQNGVIQFGFNGRKVGLIKSYGNDIDCTVDFMNKVRKIILKHNRSLEKKFSRYVLNTVPCKQE